jgi:anti-sigma factor (TIGR02949 family)
MNWIKRLLGMSSQDENGSKDMATCEEAVERLYEFLDGELDDTWRERVEEHFEACKVCLPRLTFERSFLQAVQATRSQETTPEEVRNRILQALAEGGLEPR